METKNHKMKVKYALMILIVGFAVSVIGALFKVMHWPYAGALLITATLMQVVGSIVLVYKLLTYPKIKDFLNW
jgi:hypothetical protein